MMGEIVHLPPRSGAPVVRFDRDRVSAFDPALFDAGRVSQTGGECRPEDKAEQERFKQEARDRRAHFGQRRNHSDAAPKGHAGLESADVKAARAAADGVRWRAAQEKQRRDRVASICPSLLIGAAGKGYSIAEQARVLAAECEALGRHSVANTFRSIADFADTASAELEGPAHGVDL